VSDRARPVAAIVAVVAVVAAGGCAGSSRTDDDYRHKAANTAETARSAVETVRLGVRADDRHKVTGPYLSILVGRAEDQLSSVQQTFDSRQPPSSHADDIRDSLDKLLVKASDTVSQVRIAVRRGQLGQLHQYAKDLDDVADQLDKAEEKWR
jgi:hypothetical protein